MVPWAWSWLLARQATINGMSNRWMRIRSLHRWHIVVRLESSGARRSAGQGSVPLSARPRPLLTADFRDAHRICRRQTASPLPNRDRGLETNLSPHLAPAAPASRPWLSSICPLLIATSATRYGRTILPGIAQAGSLGKIRSEYSTTAISGYWHPQLISKSPCSQLLAVIPSPRINGIASREMAENGTSTVMLKGIFEQLAEGHDLPKKLAHDLLTGMVESVTRHLKQGDRIRMGGLGTLEVRMREARQGAIRPPERRCRSQPARRLPFGRLRGAEGGGLEPHVNA